MKQYEVTFIVDPVLSGDEIKATAKTYNDHLTSNGCTIVNVDEMGLRQLAYPIKRRTSGVYYCIEFQTPTGEMINNFELAFRRDERIIRFLTVALDKYGVKYNEDKRNGLIGKKKPAASKEAGKSKPEPARKPKPVVKKAAPVVAAAAAPAVATKTEEEE